METRSRANHPNSYASQSDFGGHVRFHTNHRRSRPCGVESESPQLQPAHPGPTIPAAAHMARLVICRSGDSDDVSSLPRPLFAPDLPTQVAYSALLSLTESCDRRNFMRWIPGGRSNDVEDD